MLKESYDVFVAGDMVFRSIQISLINIKSEKDIE